MQAEKDPANQQGFWLMWEKAQERLHSFRMQQVAGGEGPNQGCKVNLHGMRQQVVCLAVAEALKPGHAGDICTCVSTSPGKHCNSNCFRSACLTVVQKRRFLGPCFKGAV